MTVLSVLDTRAKRVEMGFNLPGATHADIRTRIQNRDPQGIASRKASTDTSGLNGHTEQGAMHALQDPRENAKPPDLSGQYTQTP